MDVGARVKQWSISMKTRNHENCTGHCWHADGVDKRRTAFRSRRGLSLLIAAAVWTGAACATSSAQTVIGSPGAGFQNWTAGNLNNNGAPFWDAPTKSFGSYSGNQDSKNVGYCLTGTGDCVGIGSHSSAPGPLSFWGMSYDAVNDAGGAFDPKVYFHRGPSARTLKAILELQFTTVSGEINEIGWFETSSTGSVVGTRHILFRGGGVPPGSATPDPVGKKVTFKPTQHFGYYFSDVSENGCLAYTLSSFNDATAAKDCTNHNFVVFSANPGSHRATFWIAAEDPPGCGDGDCNLTLMKVGPADE
jgi:hypothetical protein